ncbi:F-box/WD repeat-containing protein 11 [Thecamonas trahens ATCC 50062]|uniref:F-box/WD repeat-containing protein 11 n=1 Tax=Thecamonas trahens ATCC 50062 TaxID=461836 RepID=A0A0L0DLF8_THETB|nr:F-box/WD repeat-containing protein 11 [Thecamonas trahens ATCC 50062]KNC53174.1 F-box/WD repeat-containing protein 11 [Thecamonas trahens ATCC 50062]|eukprot:XP_013754647.1 F-box/WD repeat-containing protein 11 [Thecamonas trahens ATCC 50062]
MLQGDGVAVVPAGEVADRGGEAEVAPAPAASEPASFGELLARTGPVEALGEIWVQVFEYLPTSDLRSLPLVCKRFAEMMRNYSNQLWRAVLQRQPWRETLPRKSSRNLREFYKFKTLETTRNWREGRCVFTCLWGHTDYVCCLNFDDKVLASGSMDTQIRIWDIHGDRSCVAVLEGHEGTVHQVRLQKDGTLASCSGDRTVRVWDLNTQQQVLSHTLMSSNSGTCPVYDLKSNGWGELVVACHDGSFRFLDTRVPGLEVSRVLEHTGSVLCLEWDRDRYVVTGGTDKICRTFDRRMNASLCTFAKHRRACTTIAWDGPGSNVISGSFDRTVRLWSWSTGKGIKKLTGHTESISCVQVHRKRMVTGSNDRTLRLWSLKSNRCIQTFGGFSGDVFSLQFSQSLMVNGSCRTINVWDFEALER